MLSLSYVLSLSHLKRDLGDPNFTPLRANLIVFVKATSLTLSSALILSRAFTLSRALTLSLTPPRSRQRRIWGAEPPRKIPRSEAAKGGSGGRSSPGMILVYIYIYINVYLFQEGSEFFSFLYERRSCLRSCCRSERLYSD